MKITLSPSQQDEEKFVRQRRKLTSDSNTSEVSDCWQRTVGETASKNKGQISGP